MYRCINTQARLGGVKAKTARYLTGAGVGHGGGNIRRILCIAFAFAFDPSPKTSGVLNNYW
jgi:hypothetical protein